MFGTLPAYIVSLLCYANFAPLNILSSSVVFEQWFQGIKNREQEAQGPWRSASTEDPEHKNVLKNFK